MFSETGPRSFPHQVEIVEDTIAEGSEELSVNLSSAVPGDKGVAFHRNAAQLKLMDDDSKEIIDYKLHSLCTVVRCVVHSCHCTLHETSSRFVVSLFPCWLQITTLAGCVCFQVGVRVGAHLVLDLGYRTVHFFGFALLQ